MDRLIYSTLFSGLLALAATNMTTQNTEAPKRTLGDVTIEDTVFDAPKEIRSLKQSVNALERDMTELENKFASLAKSVTPVAKPAEPKVSESVTPSTKTETVVVAAQSSGGSTGTVKPQATYQTGNGSTGGSTSSAYVYSQTIVPSSQVTYYNENGCVVDANGNVISCPRQPSQSYSGSAYSRPVLRLFRR